MGDETEPAKPGDHKGATKPGVEMANDDGADPSGDFAEQIPGETSTSNMARGNVHSTRHTGEPELEVPPPHQH